MLQHKQQQKESRPQRLHFADMSQFFLLIVTCLILVLVSSTPVVRQSFEEEAGSIPTQQRCGPADWNAVKTRLRNAITGHPEESRWPGRLLRAGFHDCFEGKCDASLVHELDRAENGFLESTFDLLRRSTRGTCVTLADSIKIGMELTMDIIGAPELNCPKGTVDANVAGPLGEIPTSEDEPDVILAGFRRKGFTVEEALAGNFGGHAIGRFDAGSIPFTPTETTFDNEFAQFVTGHSPAQSTGFNGLISDFKLAEHDTQGIVEKFANNPGALNKAFASFMLKLCSM